MMDKTSSRILKYGGLAAAMTLIGLDVYSMKQYGEIERSVPLKQEVVLTNEIDDLETRLAYCVPTEQVPVSEACINTRREYDMKNNELGRLKNSEPYTEAKEEMKNIIGRSSKRLPLMLLAGLVYLIGGVSYERHRRKERKDAEQKKKLDALKP